MIRRFNRFELKYFVTPDLKARLLDDLRRNMVTDAHGDADGAYRVTSLYFDSPDLTCFRAKVEGIKYRRKVRVRVYGPEAPTDESDTMVEIKQRINRTVQKRRTVLPLRTALALSGGDAIPDATDPRDREVISEVAFLARTLQLRPACVITYLREAWVGSPYESGLRITFDESLGCAWPPWFTERAAPSTLFFPPEVAIMEVKANEAVPLWVTHMIARHGCELRRVSKYCTGLAHLTGLPPGVTTTALSPKDPSHG